MWFCICSQHRVFSHHWWFSPYEWKHSAPVSSPKSPILNSAKSCKRAMQFLFSKVAAYNLTKKGLHQRFFPVKFVKLFRTVFNIATFGKWFCIFQAFMRFYRCFYAILLEIRRSLFWLQCDWSGIWFHNLKGSKSSKYLRLPQIFVALQLPLYYLEQFHQLAIEN